MSSEQIETMSTSNLVIYLQKMAKNVSYYTPAYRAALLTEAARRLTAYRQAERGMTSD